jgi:energy-coupling factor transporter transmembrane protein EcfT
MPDPRTALVVALLGALASLASARGAAVALVGLVAWAVSRRVSLRGLSLRALPILSGLLALLLLLPFAPARAGSLAVRGFAVSAAAVVLGSVVAWSRLLAALQELGLPRGAVAFLVILARHTETVAEEAGRAYRTLVVRGGFGRAGNLARTTGILLARVLDAALHRAEQVAWALSARGFEGRLPGLPPWKLHRDEAREVLTALLFATVLVLEGVSWSR